MEGRVGTLHTPAVIQIVNRTKVRIESLRMRYMLMIMAIAGTNGTPGALNFRSHLQIKQQIIC